MTCNDVTGTWTDSILGLQWTLLQSANNSVSGSVYLPPAPVYDSAGNYGGTCPANTYRAVAGTVTPATGRFTSITADNPDFVTATSSTGNVCSYVKLSETGTLGGSGTCTSASGTLTTVTYPLGMPFTWARTATLPDAETTVFANQWATAAGLPTLGQFKATLTSSAGLSFGGRAVNETDAQTPDRQLQQRCVAYLFAGAR